MRIMKWLASTKGDASEPTEQEVEDYIRHRVITGSPERVAAELEALNEMGIGEVLCWMKWGNLDHAQAMKSMHLLADKVMPRFG